MRTNAIIRIIIWSLVLVLSLGALLFALEWDRGDDPTDSVSIELVTVPIDRPSEDGLLKLGYTEKLKIDWPVGTITIQPGDVQTIDVKEPPVSDPKYAMVCTQEGDTLHIRYQESSSSLSIGKSLKKDLTITVPWEWYGTSLKVEMASANLILRDVSIDQVVVDTASGASSFENCTIEELDLNTASGNLDFTGRLGKLEVDAASANVTANLQNVPDSLELKSASGSFDMTLPKDAGFNAELSSVSGHIFTEFETTETGKRLLCGDGACKMEITTTSGEVTIRKWE